MGTTGIIIAIFLTIWFILTMFRERFKKKWYRSGYIDASLKYDNLDDDYKKNSYSDEADKKFNEQHTFHYD